MLDDLLHEKEDSDLEKKRLKTELAEREANLIQAGDEIRQMALKNGNDGDINDQDQMTSKEKSVKRAERRSDIENDITMDEWSRMVQNQLLI